MSRRCFSHQLPPCVAGSPQNPAGEARSLTMKRHCPGLSSRSGTPSRFGALWSGRSSVISHPSKDRTVQATLLREKLCEVPVVKGNGPEPKGHNAVQRKQDKARSLAKRHQDDRNSAQGA